MADNEFMGSALYAEWVYATGTVVLSTENRNFTFGESVETVDRTAGSDATRRSLASFKSAQASMTYTAQNDGASLGSLLRAGSIGTLNIGEAGTGSGKAKIVMPAMCTGINRTIPYADIVTYDISWVSNGDITVSDWD